MAREISKRFEETVTGTLSELAARYPNAPPKGEIVVIVGPPGEAEAAGEAEVDAALREAMTRLSPSRAAAEVAARLGSAETRGIRARATAQMKRRRAERSGRRAEWLAAWWLRLKGWRILAVRARTPVGEVDLVARRGRTLAFIEVKARASAGEADWALDEHRLRRVMRAAEALLPRYMRDGDTARIDAMFVTPWRLPRHLPNVWRG